MTDLIAYCLVSAGLGALIGRQFLIITLDKEISLRWKEVNKETIENIAEYYDSMCQHFLFQHEEFYNKKPDISAWDIDHAQHFCLRLGPWIEKLKVNLKGTGVQDG